MSLLLIPVASPQAHDFKYELLAHMLSPCADSNSQRKDASGPLSKDYNTLPKCFSSLPVCCLIPS